MSSHEEEGDNRRHPDEEEQGGALRFILALAALVLMASLGWWFRDSIVAVLTNTIEAGAVHGSVAVFVWVLQSSKTPPTLIYRLSKQDPPFWGAVLLWFSGVLLFTVAAILCLADVSVLTVTPLICVGMLSGISCSASVRELLGVGVLNMWYSAAHVVPFVQLSALILTWALQISAWNGLLFLTPPGILVIVGRACLERYIASKREARPKWFCTRDGEPKDTTDEQAAVIDSLVPQSMCTPDVRRIQLLATQAWFLGTMVFLSYHMELYMTDKNAHKTCAPVACTALVLVIMSVPVWPIDVYPWFVTTIPAAVSIMALCTGVVNTDYVNENIAQPALNGLSFLAMWGAGGTIETGILIVGYIVFCPVLTGVLVLALSAFAVTLFFFGPGAAPEVFSVVFSVALHPGTVSLCIGGLFRSIGPKYHGYRLYNSWGSLLSVPGFVYCVLYTYNRFKQVRDRLVVPWTSAEPIPEIKGGGGLSMCVVAIVVLYYIVDIVRYVIHLEGSYLSSVASTAARCFDNKVPDDLKRDTGVFSNTVGAIKAAGLGVCAVIRRDFNAFVCKDVPEAIDFADPFDETSIDLTVRGMEKKGIAVKCAAAAVCIPTAAAILLNLMLNGSQLVLYILSGIICAAVVSNVRNVWFSVVCVVAAVVVAVNLGPIGSGAPCFYRDQFTEPGTSNMTVSELIAYSAHLAHIRMADLSVDDVDNNAFAVFSDQAADKLYSEGTIAGTMTNALTRGLISRTPPKSIGEAWDNVVKKVNDACYPDRRRTDETPTVRNGMLPPHDFVCSRTFQNQQVHYLAGEIEDLPGTYKASLHDKLLGFYEDDVPLVLKLTKALVKTPSEWRQVLCDGITRSGILDVIQTDVFKMKPPFVADAPPSS